MTRDATELQMYVDLREIQKTSSQAAKYIENLESKNNFDEKNLEVIICSSLNHTSQSTLRLKAGSKNQAQFLVPIVHEMDEIKPSMLRTLTIPEDMKFMKILACRILPDELRTPIPEDIKYIRIFACGILPDGNHDDIGHLLLFSNNGMFIRKVVTFTGYPYDACFVRNDTAVVALGSAEQTALVDIEKKTITKYFKLSHNCYAVTSD
ncbi:unnamed protein product [Mytilus coruscus]|uniref:Uncharacterized protein n=1 Tax=Mytilus coruscus TaxID=42192 RepID=A0A6J8AVE1_MYTCO|nr:unnamed protein product [Mytilus coruscus]